MTELFTNLIDYYYYYFICFRPNWIYATRSNATEVAAACAIMSAAAAALHANVCASEALSVAARISRRRSAASPREGSTEDPACALQLVEVANPIPTLPYVPNEGKGGEFGAILQLVHSSHYLQQLCNRSALSSRLEAAVPMPPLDDEERASKAAADPEAEAAERETAIIAARTRAMESRAVTRKRGREGGGGGGGGSLPGSVGGSPVPFEMPTPKRGRTNASIGAPASGTTTTTTSSSSSQSSTHVTLMGKQAITPMEMEIELRGGANFLDHSDPAHPDAVMNTINRIPEANEEVEEESDESDEEEEEAPVSPKVTSARRRAASHFTRGTPTMQSSQEDDTQALPSMRGAEQSDTFVSPDSTRAAVAAASVVCRAVDAVCTGEARNAFCIVRPPGHHCGRSGRTGLDGVSPECGSQGFCLINNVCVAISHARVSWGIKRVAILDIDAHYGNGTAELLRDDSEAMYTSVQLAGLFPFTVEARDQLPERPRATSTWEQRNLVCCDVLPSSIASVDAAAAANATGVGASGRTAGPAGFRAALRDVILPAIAHFNPEVILISAGFDAHRDDPLGGAMGLRESDFVWATRAVVAIAESPGCACQGRVVSVLEGGYSTLPEKDALARCVRAHVHAMRTHPTLAALRHAASPSPAMSSAAAATASGGSRSGSSSPASLGAVALLRRGGDAKGNIASRGAKGMYGTKAGAATATVAMDEEERSKDEEEESAESFAATVARTSRKIDAARCATLETMRARLRALVVELSNAGTLWKQNEEGLVASPRRLPARGVPVPVRLVRQALQEAAPVLRQRDFATLFDVSQPLLSLWLNGRRFSNAAQNLQRKVQHWVFSGPGALPSIPPPPSTVPPSSGRRGR